MRDHLDRASLPAELTTAEGNGKRRRAVRAKFFDDARGSATECAACLDVLFAKGACSAVRVEEGKRLLGRAIAMLTKLVALYAGGTRVREDSSDYESSDATSGILTLAGGGEGEDENENEDEWDPRETLRRANERQNSRASPAGRVPAL